MQAPPVVRPGKRRSIFWVVLGVLASGVCSLLVFINLVLPEFLLRATSENLPWQGEKGVAEYEKMSGQKLPKDATCLGVHYLKFTDWHYSFFFRSSKPFVFAGAAKQENDDMDTELGMFPTVLKEVDAQATLRHPTDLRSRSWDGKDYVYFRVTSVKCDDGYYFHAEVFTT